MTNHEARNKLSSVVADMEIAAATDDQHIIAHVAGNSMARVLSIILHLMQQHDELAAEVDHLKLALAFAGYKGKP